MMLLNYIKERVYNQNTNFMGIFVGKVGTGKSWSALRIAEQTDPTFNISRVFFSIKDLLDAVEKDIIKPTQAVIFDEAGIDASNRDSYMSMKNKAIAQLNQTWRYKRIICIWTVPDISNIDAGTRKSFDTIFETKKVFKKAGYVKISCKFIDINHQSGKMYEKHGRINNDIIMYKIHKPSIKLRHKYQKKKDEFARELYKKLKEKIDPKEKVDKQAFRRCNICNTLGNYSHTRKKFVCRKCGNIYNPPKEATHLV